MNDENAIQSRYLAVRDHLDERGRRMFVAAEARAAGFGGITAVSQATGVARSTIWRGLKDLQDPTPPTDGVRRKGAGRPSLAEVSPALLTDLRALVEPATMGDPMRVLLWVSKSWAKLSVALLAVGHKISPSTVGKLLGDLGFRRQVNQKTREGSHHPDRDAQFEHINDEAIHFQAQEHPVISVDTKKKELVGDFKNGGSDYRPQGCPDAVRTHDFMDKDLGKAVPYGVYDVGANAGWVSVGIDNDTAEFAVATIGFVKKFMKRRDACSPASVMNCGRFNPSGSAIAFFLSLSFSGSKISASASCSSTRSDFSVRSVMDIFSWRTAFWSGSKTALAVKLIKGYYTGIFAPTGRCTSKISLPIASAGQSKKLIARFFD